jgi:hypothetical protein
LVNQLKITSLKLLHLSPLQISSSRISLCQLVHSETKMSAFVVLFILYVQRKPSLTANTFARRNNLDTSQLEFQDTHIRPLQTVVRVVMDVVIIVAGRGRKPQSQKSFHFCCNIRTPTSHGF